MNGKTQRILCPQLHPWVNVMMFQTSWLYSVSSFCWLQKLNTRILTNECQTISHRLSYQPIFRWGALVRSHEGSLLRNQTPQSPNGYLYLFEDNFEMIVRLVLVLLWVYTRFDLLVSTVSPLGIPFSFVANSQESKITVLSPKDDLYKVT